MIQEFVFGAIFGAAMKHLYDKGIIERWIMKILDWWDKPRREKKKEEVVNSTPMGVG